jgi:hypothetical protein
MRTTIITMRNKISTIACGISPSPHSFLDACDLPGVAKGKKPLKFGEDDSAALA